MLTSLFLVPLEISQSHHSTYLQFAFYMTSENEHRAVYLLRTWYIKRYCLPLLVVMLSHLALYVYLCSSFPGLFPSLFLVSFFFSSLFLICQCQVRFMFPLHVSFRFFHSNKAASEFILLCTVVTWGELQHHQSGMRQMSYGHFSVCLLLFLILHGG